MSVNRSHLVAAAVLLTATAVAGIAARGFGVPAVPPPDPTGARPTAFSAGSSGPIRFSGTLDRTAVQRGRDGIARMELVIAADKAPSSQRRPTDLVVVLDRSGSMQGDKMVHARAALIELLDQLGDADRFGLVTYSSGARTELAMQPATADNRARWKSHAAGLDTEGGTNMSAGLDAGLAMMGTDRGTGRIARLVLISDGLANEGDYSFDGLLTRAKHVARAEYMLSTVGVGEDFNEDLMTALADAGTGNYYFVADPRELGNVFASEFDAARTTVASNLTVRIQPGSGIQVLDAAGYPLERADGVVRFSPGALFSGQERRIWVTLGVPHSALGELALGSFAIEFDGASGRKELGFTESPRIACVASEDEFYAGVDVDTWSRGVSVDGYNKMQAEVAREVKQGKRGDAEERLHVFKAEADTMNARLKSPRVAESLGALDQLQRRVEDAFVGPDQQARQNALSKAAGAAAIDDRRPGAKK